MKPCARSFPPIGIGSSGWSICGSAAAWRAGSTIRTCSRRPSSRSPGGFRSMPAEPEAAVLPLAEAPDGAQAGRGPPSPPGHQLRDADREVTLHRGGLPLADSVSLAAQLLGTLTTPSQAAIKAETRLLVQEALNGMDPIDREVLALKHFEQLSTVRDRRGAGPVQGRRGQPLPAGDQAPAGRSLAQIPGSSVLSAWPEDVASVSDGSIMEATMSMSSRNRARAWCSSWPRSSSTATARASGPSLERVHRPPSRSWPPRSARSSRRWR